ncbi:Hms1p KNAG_0B03160 [Huiozyma naganishii CBS 8797]|uniref:BHLH domain-containing protein n=1 Tax=Huiozyma naganishii (strain ATCC MYA-139 / BCRC 22969 / CBS 8797 / KCTC 17520 / NBRC 10181 / NCYC 3082 / Yp74L-3) TaxID=1071383 RepID=J7RV33_HUIN7|nr:hypothetical protein KNAG_0B03160 [Kazachstania naganishii CBS 8797]CCK68757.1 hypothetical protein KNAG_0B03160 [Kazachstania naganishii CBS 8797]
MSNYSTVYTNMSAPEIDCEFDNLYVGPHGMENILGHEAISDFDLIQNFETEYGNGMNMSVTANTNLDSTGNGLHKMDPAFITNNSSNLNMSTPGYDMSEPATVCTSNSGPISRVSSVSPIRSRGVVKYKKGKKVKASHNDIEKKYRTSINSKIAELSELVPTIRYGQKESSSEEITQKDIDDLDGLQPTKKLNKGTILTKTIEYLTHLENKCNEYKMLNKKLMNNNNYSISQLPIKVEQPEITSSRSQSVGIFSNPNCDNQSFSPLDNQISNVDNHIFNFCAEAPQRNTTYFTFEHVRECINDQTFNATNNNIQNIIN